MLLSAKAPMNIRLMSENDIEKLRQIHEIHYKTEFTFDDFLRGFLSAYIIEDSEGIICAGGVRPLIECVAVTNKDRSVRARRQALYSLLQASMFWCGANKVTELHAFIQDEKWLNQLKKVGFQETKGKSIVMFI